jgi:hypothetical protein
VMVRYERLRVDPQSELERICRILRISATARDIAAAIEEHSYERVPGSEKGAGKAIRLARPGSWRDHMNPTEIRAMHAILGDKLDELGYLRRTARRYSVA